MLTTLLVVTAAWMFVSFSCSLMEACVLSVSSADLAVLEPRHPRIVAIWRRFKEQLQHPLSVILILNTLAHTLGAAFSGMLFEKQFGTTWLWVFTLAVSFVMIQWTEILPKSLGSRHNRSIALAIGVPLSIAVAVMRPLVKLIHLLNRPFERRTSGSEADPLEDLYAMTRLAALSRAINPAQERMIAGATKLSSLTAKDLMIPLQDISFLSTEMSLNEALAKAHADGHTRFPVYEGGEPDRVAGYVTFKEVVGALRANPQDASLKGICRPIVRIPAEEQAASVLRTFVQERQHIAIVHEAERTSGLITLEDILEEPLGDLTGEPVQLPANLQDLGSGRWIAGGGLPTKELLERLGKPMPGIPEEGSVSRWIRNALGHVPKVNDTVEQGGLRMTVRRVRRRQVFEATLIEL